ncbi:DUF1707 domain-containing protein [Amycolatopsis sp. FDAARGOS 1241]|uniref:DUF1707 SHOCT-like domain-containing protein n=1 Tax=Amycolatopsis sp. FDAARGOS 1241 TaxID=2778070 RepID=UPI0019524FC9|nr:DUF1707 domain-containing protein [Amycolatopsis sp. FDAARGOS 1241]QRP50178.1 DUF1707 domain-containing protein [Amycolatopsis sp. FDAARGOS 1241]
MAAEEPTEPGALRCSDAEREAAAAALQNAAGEGRLSLAEVEDRTATVYSARYRHELDAVLADLPRAAPPVPGWRPVLALAAQQFAADVVSLTGGGPAAARRRAVLIAAVVLAFAVVLLLAAHGITGDGPHHGFGHH